MIDRRAVPFIVVLLWFAFTSPGMWRGSEPYPAILMPGFVLPRDDGGVRSIAWPEITAVLSDGDVVTLSARRLLGPLPPSHVETTLEAFRPPDSISAGRPQITRPHASPLLDLLLPGRRIRREYEAAGRRFDVVASREWLRRKVERLAGGRPARELRFDWYEEILRPGAMTPARARHVGRFVVEFSR